MPTVGVLCHIRQGGQVLLQKKAEGLWGGGKWNAPGGKLRSGESPEEGVVREVFEETGLQIDALRYHATLTFFFGPGEEPDWIVHVFSASRFSGQLRSSGEGQLRWFPEDQIPYDEMWPDDRHWLPHLLVGKQFEATFWFDEKTEKLLRHRLALR